VKKKLVLYSTNRIENITNGAGKIQSFLMLNPLEHLRTNGFKRWNENEKEQMSKYCICRLVQPL
jgi:hypothetical protein